MGTSPGFDPDVMSRAIQAAYAIPVRSMEYLPVGMVGRHFRVDSVAGDRYFITLYDDARLARIAASKLDFTLPAVDRLYRCSHFTDLVPPLETVDGKLHIEINGHPVIVFPYLGGHLLADEMPLSASTQAELGGLVARLHAATPVVEALPDPLRERFIFPFEAPLREGLESLAQVDKQAPPGQIALRDLLLPRKKAVLRLLAKLRALAQPLRSSPPPFVICHTDIHPWNVIRTPEGRLVVIDWEGACLAPPEYDLFIFMGQGFESFLDAYYQAGGRRGLDAETFSFYFYRRTLEDLADYVVRIMDENNGPEIDCEDLAGVTELIAGWADLPKSADRMRGVLDQV